MRLGPLLDRADVCNFFLKKTECQYGVNSRLHRVMWDILSSSVGQGSSFHWVNIPSVVWISFGNNRCFSLQYPVSPWRKWEKREGLKKRRGEREHAGWMSRETLESGGAERVGGRRWGWGRRLERTSQGGGFMWRERNSYSDLSPRLMDYLPSPRPHLYLSVSPLAL